MDEGICNVLFRKGSNRVRTKPPRTIHERL